VDVRLVVAMTGASGVVYGVRLLEVLREKNVEVYLVISEAAEKVIMHELGISRKDVEKLADHVYDVNDLGAPIVSGSFKTDGMVVIPCSMKTLAGLACGYSDNLLLRAGDVTMKERRTLILVVREAPFSVIHLRNMLELARMGVVVLPASPAFYHKPKTVGDLVDYVVGKVLDCLGVEHGLFRRWSGFGLE